MGEFKQKAFLQTDVFYTVDAPVSTILPTETHQSTRQPKKNPLRITRQQSKTVTVWRDSLYVCVCVCVPLTLIDQVESSRAGLTFGGETDQDLVGGRER